MCIQKVGQEFCKFLARILLLIQTGLKGSMSIKFNNSVSKSTILLTAILFLTSCGGGDDKGVPPSDTIPDPVNPNPKPIPPPLEGTVISGAVIIGPVVNADVTIYEITLDKSSNAIKLIRTPLGSSTQKTTDKGEYQLAIKPTADTTPILVCATGGTYTEPASVDLAVPVEKSIRLKDVLCPKTRTCNDEELCAIAIVKRDEKLKVNLTYFSHLAYGLASSRISNGSTLLDVTHNNSDGSTSLILGGISNANKIVSDWLQLSTTTTTTTNKGVISVTPQDITVTPTQSGTITLTNEIKYGLANAAISDLVEWMRLTSSATQTGPAFDQVSTIALAQQVFIDIADGDLDGLQNANPLFLSDTAIKGHMLRYHFAFKLFVVATNRSINRTGLNNADIDSYVKALNKNGVLFPSTPQVNIVNNSPVFSHIYPNDNGILTGDVSIRIDATDIADISSIAMTIDTVPPGGNLSLPTNVLAANPDKPEWLINTVSEATIVTPGIPDGIYDIKFVATNTQGATTTRSIPNVRIANSDIHLHIINPPEVVTTSNTPKNPINTLAGFEAIVNDVFFQESATSSKVEFTIESTTPGSNMTPIPVPFKMATSIPNGYSEISSISRRYFASDLSANAAATIPDGKYKFVVNAVSGKNIKPPVVAQAVMVDFEYDTGKPTVNYLTPNFKVFTGLATIDLDITDPQKDVYSSGIKSQNLTHDGLAGEIPTTINGSQSIFNLNDQGWHRLTLNAVDYAGNAADTVLLNVGLDTTNPSVMIPKSSIENLWWNNVDIITNISDNETGIQEIVTGFDHVDIQTLEKAAIGSNVDLSNKPQPPNLYGFHKEIITLNAKNNQGLANKVHSYAVRASDYAAPAVGHTQHDIVNFGFDTKSPTIIFTNASTVFTAITNDAKVTINKQQKTVSVSNWPVDAVVEETGYQAPNVNGKFIQGTTSSGIASVTIDTVPVAVTSADFLQLTASTTKSVSISNLPQYVVTSTATKQVVWTVIATCPAPIVAGSSVRLKGTQCEEVSADSATKTKVATVYQWTPGIASYINTSDASAIDTPTVTKTPIIVTATDQTLSSDSAIAGGTPDGNPVIKTACLNYRISNITSDTAILVPARLANDIGLDSLAVENASSPIAGINTTEPLAANICEEGKATIGIPWNGTPLDPILDPTLAGVANTTSCTILGIPSSTISTRLPLANDQNYQVEMQLDSQGVCS